MGETIEEAAIREIEEETGLIIELGPIVEVVDMITKDACGKIQFHYTLIDFYADWLSGDAVANDDISETKWVAIDELDSIQLRDETRQVAEKAISLRKL